MRNELNVYFTLTLIHLLSIRSPESCMGNERRSGKFLVKRVRQKCH